ncbi:AtpZ/AtpI family protein [bacterium]|nr:AtpZ/AtpI family protein [candidate division CSSED10-310 bacterium]
MLKEFVRVMNFGLEMAIAILIGVLAGRWLDAATGWSPLFIILGVLLGIAAGFVNLFKAIGLIGEAKARAEDEDP